MRSKTTLFLGLILVALAVFYYVYEVRLGPEREKVAQAKGRLWTVEARDVDEAIFKRKTGTVHLRRNGEKWMLVAPVKAKADSTTVDDLISSVVTAKVRREIDPHPTELVDFGLDVPAVDVTLKVKDQDELLTLLLGDKNPTGTWVYAKTRDEPAVFMLSTFLLREATKPVADFRDRTILAFDREAVTRLEITLDGDRMAAEPEAEKKWRITEPVSLPADWETISDILDKLRFGKVKEFAAEAPRSLTPYGLDRPARVTVFLGQDEDRAAQALLFGKADTAKQGVYAMRPGDTSVLLVGEDVWRALPKTVGALRDKTVVAYDRNKVDRLELESPKGKVALAKEEERWRITAPKPLRADNWGVRGIIWKLGDLRAVGFLGEGPAALDRYLRKPQVKVSLWEEGESAPKTLLLAPSRDTRGGRPMAYAGVVGQGSVMLVDAETLEDLSKSATDIRDRALLPLFDPKDVKRVRLKSSGHTMVVERRGHDWRITEPKSGKVPEGRAADLFDTLHALRWKELVSATGEDAARYGFDAPRVEIILFKSDDTKLDHLVVGRQDADKVYVRTGASPEIFSMDPNELDDLPKIPDDLEE